MGCDIHLKVEIQAESGEWHRAEDVIPNKYYEPGEIYANNTPETRDEWYHGRNYSLFSVLAGVRGYGLPIREPRGIPKDACLETKDEFKAWEGDAHTPHWYSLRELTTSIARLRDPEVYGQDFITNVIDRMIVLCNEELEGDGERIRTVFWFDN